MLPNPFRSASQAMFPELGLIAELLKLLVVVALVWVTGKYFTRNRAILAAIALIAMYILFV